jgi:ComF family protein
MLDDEIMVRESFDRTIAPDAAQRTIEDFGIRHRGPCAASVIRGQGAMHPALRVAYASIRLVVQFALPPRCPGCGTITVADHLFCYDCWRSLEFLVGPACATCGEPFEIDPGPDARCGACLADPPAMDGLRAAVSYGPIARALALRLKYGGRPGVARTLARQMKRLIADADDALLVPVPLHRWRLWRRGYNQAALIGRALARETGTRFSPDLLERTRATPILRGMGPRERRRAVSGAFRIRPERHPEIAGQRIILIDDVYTTGATANACARTLKRAGAASVTICCWARVTRDIDIEGPG